MLLRMATAILFLVHTQASSAEGHGIVGSSFASARASLLRAGWRPRQTQLPRGDGHLERSTGSAAQFYMAGYREVEVCAGTGSNPCVFNYLRDGHCLRVFTTGETLRTSVVKAVSEECPPIDAR